MSRASRFKRRRSSSKSRWVLFLAGGIVTAILLVVVLVSLEEQSPVQSALPEPPIGKARIKPKASPPSAPMKIEEPTATIAPEPFTFYDTLEQKNTPSPNLLEKASRPTPRSVSPATPPAGLSKVPPKKQSPRYTIQIAAIKDRPTAEALRDRLKKKGYPVFILRYVIPNRGTWYRVRLGHFTKREAAQEMARQLSRREQLTTYVAKE